MLNLHMIFFHSLGNFSRQCLFALDAATASAAEVIFVVEDLEFGTGDEAGVVAGSAVVVNKSSRFSAARFDNQCCLNYNTTMQQSTVHSTIMQQYNNCHPVAIALACRWTNE